VREAAGSIPNTLLISQIRLYLEISEEQLEIRLAEVYLP